MHLTLTRQIKAKPMRFRSVAVGLLLSAVVSAAAADDTAVEAFRSKFGIGPLAEFEIPLVACAQDGQADYIPPPKLPPTTQVRLPDDGRAASLTFYSKEGHGRAGVIAPRGWSCMGSYGSSGDSLTVRPRSAKGDVWKASYPGPHVTRSVAEGGTSGRFHVAEVAARLFPAGRPFAREVENEDPGTRKYATAPWPRDRLTPLRENLTAFETPGGGQGLGMQGDGPYAAQGIEGLVLFSPGDRDDGDPYLLQLDVRPDQEMADLYTAAAIVFLDRLRPASSPRKAVVQPPDGTPEGSGAVMVVRAFYEALGRADGETASTLVIHEKRKSGPYAAGSITRFYGSLTEPLRLLSAAPAGGDSVQVRYRYRKPNGSVCDGAAVVQVAIVDREALITRIKPANGC